MTPTNLRLLDFVRDYITARAYAPTYEEMMEHMGLSSKSSIARILRALIREGLLVHDAGSGARNISIPSHSLAAVPTAALKAEIDRRAGQHG